MIDLREFAEEQERERLREISFQEWALPRIKDNFGVPGYDMELRKEFDKEHGYSMELVFSEEIVNKFLKK